MIPKQFTLTRKLYDEYKEDYQSATPTQQAVDECLKNKKTGNWWHYDLGQSFHEEYHYHVKADLYFSGSPFAKYESTYEERKKKYLSKSIDSLEIDFIINELNTLSQVGFTYCPTELRDIILHSVKRQKDFLLNRSRILGFTVTSLTDKWGFSKYDYTKHFLKLEDQSYVDLSDSSLSEKIIYLESLGLLEHLKTLAKNGFSIMGLASLLSGIIGGKPETIQSYLNPINNETVSQKNNPMKKSKNVNRIQHIITKLGFTLRE